MLNNKTTNIRGKVPETSVIISPSPSYSVCIIKAKQHGSVSHGASGGFNAGNLLHGNVLLNVLMTGANQ